MAIFNKKTDTATAKTPTVKTAAKAAPEKSMKELYGTDRKAVTKEAAQAPVTRSFDDAHRILVKPLITEKAAALGTRNQYVFAVATSANKITVSKAVAAVYGIEPVAVRIITMAGKAVRYGRTKGKRNDWKKAIVTLPAGKTINLYEGV